MITHTRVLPRMISIGLLSLSGFLAAALTATPVLHPVSASPQPGLEAFPDDEEPDVPVCAFELTPWIDAGEAPVAHLEGATAVVNGKLYVIAGFTDSGLHATGTVDVYNPTSGIWETFASKRQPLPTPLSHSMAVVDGQWIWMAGGFEGNHPGPATDMVWKYDTVNDLWYAGPPLPDKRAAGALVKVGRELHYFGGTSVDRDTEYANHWVLNLDQEAAGWQNAPDLPTARVHLSGSWVNQRLYALGGQLRHDHDPVDLNVVEIYDPATGLWTNGAPVPLPRSHFEPGTTLINDQIVIVGGRANQSGQGFGQLDRVTAYNPVANRWCKLRPLPVDLIAPNAALIGDQLIVTGGGVLWNVPQNHTYISSILSLDCSTVPAGEVELLVNGCFEDRDGSNHPDITPWVVQQQSSDKVRCNTSALEGNCAFRFKGEYGENSRLQQQVAMDQFTFVPGDTLVLNGYIDAQTGSTHAWVKVIVTYTDSALKRDKLKIELSPTFGYQKLNDQTIKLASGQVSSIKVQVQNHSAKGKLFLDAVSLRLLSGESHLSPIPLPLP